MEIEASADIQTLRRLVQPPEGLGKIGIEIKKPTKLALWDFSGRQVHTIQSAEQR